MLVRLHSSTAAKQRQQQQTYPNTTTTTIIIIIVQKYIWRAYSRIKIKNASAYANSALYSTSSYIINQGCNVHLIQMKAARKVQVIISQFQQFRHKTNSSAFTNRESTFIISCEKRCLLACLLTDLLLLISLCVKPAFLSSYSMWGQQKFGICEASFSQAEMRFLLHKQQWQSESVVIKRLTQPHKPNQATPPTCRIWNDLCHLVYQRSTTS